MEKAAELNSKLLLANDLLDPDAAKNSNAIADAARAALYAGIVDPVRGVAQIVDRTVGSTLDSKIKDYSQSLVQPVVAAEFATSNWFGQQLGSAVGMMAPYLLARAGVKSVADKAFGEAVLTKIHTDGMRSSIGSSAVSKLAASEAAISGASGFAYGLVFVPGENANGSVLSFLGERVKSATYDAAAFGSIGAMSPYMGKAIGIAAKKIDDIPINRLVGNPVEYEAKTLLARIAPPAKNGLVEALRGPVIPGALSGIPIGLVNAEVAAIKAGNWFPDSKEIKENVVAMMFVGGAIASANRIMAPRPQETAKSEPKMLSAVSDHYDFSGRDGRGFSINRVNSMPLYSRSLQILEPLSDSYRATDTPLNFRSERTAPFRDLTLEELPMLDHGPKASARENLSESKQKAQWSAPEHLKDLKEQDLKLLGSVWSTLTKKQQQLPAEQILQQAQVVRAMNLNEAGAGKLFANAEFLPWFETNKDAIAKETFGAQAILETWIKHPEFRDRSPKELISISKLTDAQRQKSLAEVLKLAEIVETLRLDAQQAVKLEHSPDFLNYFDSKKTELQRMHKNHEFNANIVNFWSEFPADLKQLNPKDIASVAYAWDVLTPEHKKMSAQDLIVIGDFKSATYMEPAVLAKMTPDFISWYRNNSADKKVSIADGYKDILSVWSELSPELRAMKVEDLRVVALLSPELRAQPLSKLQEYVQLAEALQLKSEAKNMNPEFLAWAKANEKDLAPLVKNIVREHPSKIARHWNELPEHVRKLPAKELSIIAEAWPNLTEKQRALPVKELLLNSKIISDLYIGAKEAATLAESPDFPKVYARLESRWRESSTSWSTDMTGLLNSWKELPEQIKQLRDRDLIVIGSSWNNLTAEQRRLPMKEVAAVASIVRDLRLSETDTALMANAPGFVEWYERKGNFDRAFDYSKHTLIRELLPVWSELKPDLLKLSASELAPIVSSWKSLTPEQKALPAAELAAQGVVIKKLRLEGAEIGALSQVPDFAVWFSKNREHHILENSYLREGQKGIGQTILSVWSELPADRSRLKVHEANDIALSWSNLSAEQKKLPIADLKEHARIVQELSLNETSARKLQEDGLVAWFKERDKDLRKLGLRVEDARYREKNEHLKASVQKIVDMWSELSPSQRQSRMVDLRAAGSIWDLLNAEQKTLPIQHLAKVATVKDLLRLKDESAAKLVDLPEFITWFDKNVDYNLVTHVSKTTAGIVFHKWSELSPKDSRAFATWLENASNGQGGMSQRQLPYLDQVASKWEYLSEHERTLPIAEVLDKVDTLNKMTSEANARLVWADGQAAKASFIPFDIANKVTGLKPWEQIAALRAWNDTVAKFDGTITVAKWKEWSDSKEFHQAFDQNYHERISAGRVKILAESGDARKIIKSYHPGLEPVFVDLIADGLKQESRPDGYIQRINPREYKQALAAMLGENANLLESLSKLNVVEAADHPFVVATKGGQNWQNDSALKLVTTFGTRWKSVNAQKGWLELQDSLGRNAHDATVWLAMAAKPHAATLGDFLLKHYDRNPSEIGVIAKRWTELTDQQRDGGTYKEILAGAVASKYDNQKNLDFAIEAARWGVAADKYPLYESKFIRSQEIPFPFPLDKSWTHQDLTGRFIPRSDARGVFLGRYTNCCQHPDHTSGTSAAWMGQENPNAGFFVVENKKKEVVAQSLVWEADNGGLVFDSIEGKGLGDRAPKVADLYEKLAADMKNKYHTINVGVGSAAGSEVTSLKRWARVSEGEKISKPFDYGGYTDTSSQLAIAINPEIPKREQVAKQVWIRGAGKEDMAAAQSIINQVYPPNWRFIPGGDWHRVMEARGKGIIGGYILDTSNRMVNEAFVHPDYRSNSRVLLFDMMRKLRHEGGEWSASFRDSTSYQLLERAVKARWITITGERKAAGKMQGEDMHDVTFTINSAARPAH